MKSPHLFFWISVVIIILLGTGIFFVGVAKKEFPIAFPDLAGTVRDPDFYEPVAEGWHRIDLGAFKISLPDDFVYIRRRGIDSYVGEFFDGERRIWFDYGWYSPTISGRDKEKKQYVTDKVCGQELYLVLPDDKSGFSVSFPYLQNESLLYISADGDWEGEAVKKVVLSIGIGTCEGTKYVSDVSSRLTDSFDPGPDESISNTCTVCHNKGSRNLYGPGLATISRQRAVKWYFSEESTLDSSEIGIGPYTHRQSFPLSISEIEDLFSEP